MNKTNKYSPRVHQRAARMVQEVRGDYPSLWATLLSIAPKTGCNPATLLSWIKRTEIDNGPRRGIMMFHYNFHRPHSATEKNLQLLALTCL